MQPQIALNIILQFKHNRHSITQQTWWLLTTDVCCTF